MKKGLSILLKSSVVVIGWALTPVIGEYLIDYNRQLSPYQLAFFRYFLAAVALYFILIFQQKVKNKEIIDSLKNKWPKYILVSIMSAFMPVLLFLAVENTSASSASFLLNSNIILIPIFAIIILKEKMKKNYVIGIAVSTIGLFLVIFDNNLLALADLSFDVIIGNLLAFGSGFFWALYTVFLKKFFADENPILVTFISLLMGSFYLVFFAFAIPPYVTMTLDFLGIVLAYLFIAFGQAIIVYGIAFIFGGRFHGSIWLGFIIIVLSVFSFVGAGFFFGARFTKRTEDVNGPVAAFGVPLLVLGGTFFPVSILPSYLLTLAYLNPIFHMNQALKSVSALGNGIGDISTHLIFLIVFTVMALLLGARSYKSMLLQEKKG